MENPQWVKTDIDIKKKLLKFEDASIAWQIRRPFSGALVDSAAAARLPVAPERGAAEDQWPGAMPRL